MNAVELLVADHKVVAGLFAQVKASKDNDHPALFVKIKAELDVHTHVEETIFYPKLKAEGNKALIDITLEGLEEHHQVKMFLKELDSLTKDSEKLKEEEETMFPLVREQFKPDVLDALGAEMEQAKKDFQKSSSASAGR